MENSENSGSTTQVPEVRPKTSNIRNLTAFWLLGLTNNFGYVVMLSAAHDILADEPGSKNGTETANATTASPHPGHLIPNCNKIGTGAILLADILPALFVKLTAPFFVQYIPYFVKVAAVALCGIASFPVVATSNHSVPQAVAGVVIASLGSGLGEITFLSLSVFFSSNVISAWGSGTGMAGIAGALAYAALTSRVVGLSPSTTLFILTFVPVVLAVSYYLILVKPEGFDPVRCCCCSNGHMCPEHESETAGLIQDEPEDQPPVYDANITLTEKFIYLKPLIKYMLPLGLVYFAEYFINQALFELIQFEDIWISTAEQYRWYQVLYQVGVFISRSSLCILKINKLWILVILQFVNVALLFLDVILQFIPVIWIIFALILWEGLLGGAAYVNTFYKVSKEVREEAREFSMGVVSLADSCGIAIAGFLSIPVHNKLCTL